MPKRGRPCRGCGERAAAPALSPDTAAAPPVVVLRPDPGAPAQPAPPSARPRGQAAAAPARRSRPGPQLRGSGLRQPARRLPR